ncbi:MAG: signal transduction histidine kinase, partial [Polyangiales bacterium]
MQIFLFAMATLLPKTLLSRLVVVTSLALIIAMGVLLLQSSRRISASIERGERARLEAIASTLALAVDGDIHERIVRSVPDRIDRWNQAPVDLKRLQEQLAAVRQRNGLTTAIETIIVGDTSRVRAVPDQTWPGAMLVIGSSRSSPTFRSATSYRPAMAEALTGKASVTEPYANPYGTWLAAYAPITNRAGEVVGLLKVDTSLDLLLDAATERTRQLAFFCLLLLVVTLSAMVLAVAQVTRALSELGTLAGGFGGGDFDSPITVSSSSAEEVRLLARALEGARRQLALHLKERARAAEELTLARDRAEDAAQVKSQFLANMSHELRTPMNAIIGYSEILIEETGEFAEQTPQITALLNDLRKIRRAGRQLLALVNDVLDLAKVEAGKMSVFAERFALSELFVELEELMAPLLEGNELIFRCKEELVMSADRTRVRQILLNLLGNAAKFTEKGTITLSAQPDADTLVFEVTDTGIGMSASQCAQLFQPFTQVDTSSTRRYGGTGLGLALGKEFTELLGGNISVTSEVGVGSVFRVVLPR